MAKGETKVIVEDDDNDSESDCDDDNAISYNDIVAMLIRSDEKLHMERGQS